MENRTALASAFARACHYRNHTEPVFADLLAENDQMKQESAESAKNRELDAGRMAKKAPEGVGYGLAVKKG